MKLNQYDLISVIKKNILGKRVIKNVKHELDITNEFILFKLET